MGCKGSKALPPGAVQESKSFDEGSPRQLRRNNNNKATSTPSLSKAGGAGSHLSSSSSTSDDRVYKLLVKVQNGHQDILPNGILKATSPSSAAYQNPNTKSTPLHMAVRLLDAMEPRVGLDEVLDSLIRACPDAVHVKDAAGNIPLHYAIAPSYHFNAPMPSAESWKLRAAIVRKLLLSDTTSSSIRYLHRNDILYESKDATGGCTPLYRALQTIPDDFDPTGPTVMLVYVLVQALASVNTNNKPSVAVVETSAQSMAIKNSATTVPNASDGDQPLALLYRRFTRQFDLAEKFFSGDNSRPEVVQYRHQYKTAAGNTWRMMEALLWQSIPDRSGSSSGGSSNNNNNNPSVTTRRLVHRAVQVETPPDLLRYIVETNAEELTQPDEDGNLPLHCAAMSKSAASATTATTLASTSSALSQHNNPPPPPRLGFPAFYSKYVMDELLYKYPEAASKVNKEGLYPLTLAVRAGKQWIGGGIKSLYDAYPDALQQISLEEHAELKLALSMEDSSDAALLTSRSMGVVEDGGSTHEDKKVDSVIAAAAVVGNGAVEESDGGAGGIIRDEHHDAIMLVQQSNVDISEVVTSMWAHEEDAGVQMLGCMAVARMVRDLPLPPPPPATTTSTGTSTTTATQQQSRQRDEHLIRIALSAVPAVVNAMKAHPNEVIVQEKAAHVLKQLAPTDGHREISFVASGAVAAIVGAMQAHVSDATVQEEACGALAQIVHYGGDDRATIVASVSGLTAIMNAIAAHPENRGVQRDGCEALRELMEFPKANLPDIPRSQTESLLESARTNFPEDCASTVEILLSRMT